MADPILPIAACNWRRSVLEDIIDEYYQIHGTDHAGGVDIRGTERGGK